MLPSALRPGSESLCDPVSVNRRWLSEFLISPSLFPFYFLCKIMRCGGKDHEELESKDVICSLHSTLEAFPVQNTVQNCSPLRSRLNGGGKKFKIPAQFPGEPASITYLPLTGD